MRENLTIGFIGNPNCGKTTLFNAYTGANLKVANWPGVTVEKVEGAIKDHDLNIRLVDLPGTYSLTSYTMEEQVSRQFILSDEVDVIIDVADASALERNLYLTLQLLELGKPVVLALNMMDIVEKRGMEIDTHRLPEMLGIPVIPVSARKRTGLDVLLHAAAHHKDCKDPECLIHHHKYKPKHRHDHHSEYAMVYSDAIEDKIDLIMAELKRKYPNLTNYRWHAIKLLEQDKEISERYPVSLPDVIDRNYESDIINEKYDFIQEIIREVLVNKDRQDALTEKVDRALTHRVWGIPIFLGIMAVVFFLTFTIGDWLKGYFEMGIESLSALLSDGLVAAGVNEMLRSLLVDGIVAGVGGILTFLPNIFILFLALAFLEDSGYMARVAYVMEGIMSKLGLSGRAFIPMILGFGCTVPAIMASRALENRRDRFKVMLITPFMSCSARLPIYILFAEMFFQEHAMLVAYSMYLIGLLVAILVAAVIHLIDRRKSENYLLIELPEYKIPSSRTVAIYVASVGDQQDSIEMCYEDENIWLTQKMMATLYDVDVRTINEHIKKIYSDSELEEDSTIRNFRIVQTEGSRQVTRDTKHYNLQMIIAVGFKVNSERAVQFRKWVNQIAKDYTIKGWVMDDERLKRGTYLTEKYFDEQLERIREIRASERKFYQKITDLYATAIDYDKNAATTRRFYATVQNKMHYAVHGHTAAELIVERADHTKEHMGLTTWADAPDGKIKKSDVTVAKNYLSQDEMKQLNRMVTAYLDFAENMTLRHIPLTMQDWEKRLNSFIEMFDYGILQDAGKVSAEIAKLHAETEFEKYRVIQDRLFMSDFDKYMLELEENTKK